MRLSRVARPAVGLDAFHLTQLRQLAVVALAALFARLWIFHDVAVNGDTGLYLYDAKQLLWGRQMFVDFPSRSPVMEHLLAGAVAIADSPLVGARSFMVVVGMALGLAVYGVARQLHSHEAGLVGATVFYFTPFSLVWGLWVKTEPVADLLMLATFAVVIYAVRLETVPVWAGGAVGAGFGVAFFVRRVVVVHAVAVALFVVWYRYRAGKLDRSVLTAGVATVVGGLSVLAVGYLALARFDPRLAWQMFDVHALALVLSDGQGSLGWVGLPEATPVTGTADAPWWHTLCQKCGLNTVQTFISTILATLPAVALLLIMLRSYLEHYSRTLSLWVAVSYSLLGVYAVSQLPLSTYPWRAVAAVVLVAAMAVVWYFDVPAFDEWWRRDYALVVLALLGLTAGYLYRDRILYPTYFQDFYPLLSVLVGILTIEFWRANRDRARQLAVVGAVVLVAAMGVAGANAYPYQPNGVDEDSHWHTIEGAQAYGEDIEQRTEPGERVYTAQPLYVIEADRRLAADLSRKYYAFRGWPDSPQQRYTEQQLMAEFGSGDTTYAVADKESRIVHNASSDEFNQTFGENYCRVEDDELYQRTGGELYRWCGS